MAGLVCYVPGQGLVPNPRAPICVYVNVMASIPDVHPQQRSHSAAQAMARHRDLITGKELEGRGEGRVDRAGNLMVCEQEAKVRPAPIAHARRIARPNNIGKPANERRGPSDRDDDLLLGGVNGYEAEDVRLDTAEGIVVSKGRPCY